MDYVWEQVLGKDLNCISFKQADVFSPYFETTGKEQTTSQSIEYNGMYRYGDIFERLYENKAHISDETRAICFDVITHLLVQLDLLKGMSHKEYERYWYRKKILSGSYGVDIADLYKLLRRNQQYLIAFYMQKMNRNGPCTQIFAKAVIDLLGQGVVYSSRIRDKQLYIYVGRKKNKKDEQIVLLAENLFLPLDYKSEIFWNHHFGVLNEPCTLQYGTIQIL